MNLVVSQEEEMMLERFGDEYREYKRRTGRFLPRLGREAETE
jgi:protein-S-isoprenylcysteine O-methyltransferase Ste14